jgi:hypothetical protein
MKVVHLNLGGEGECNHEACEEAYQITEKITVELRKVFRDYYQPLRHHPEYPAAMTSTAISFMVGVLHNVGDGFKTVEKRNEYYDHIKASFDTIFKELKNRPFEEE